MVIKEKRYTEDGKIKSKPLGLDGTLEVLTGFRWGSMPWWSMIPAKACVQQALAHFNMPTIMTAKASLARVGRRGYALNQVAMRRKTPQPSPFFGRGTAFVKYEHGVCATASDKFFAKMQARKAALENQDL